MNKKGFHHLTRDDRLKIEGALRAGAKVADIAKSVGVCRKTIYNEIRRGMCVQQKEGYIFEEVYCADVAERKYQENLRAKGPDIKLGKDFAFANFVEDMIVNNRFSPGAVLHFIKENGIEFDTQICETTLYSYIYRGDVFMVLNKNHLLYKGDRRSTYTKQERASQPRGESIERRAAEVLNRETFGHWEMDSIMGIQGSRAALVVLTERLTRFGIVCLVPDHTAASVVRVLDRLERKMGKEFRKIFKSITVDNGCEFADCAGMEKSCRAQGSRTKVYYCHPYSPHERGSNENMNRILRRFFPKGTNFDEVKLSEVKTAEAWMNNYPREILGWKTSSAMFGVYAAA